MKFLAKPFRFRFDKVDGIIKIYDRTRYLVSLGPERYSAIYDRTRYLISEKITITYSINRSFARIRIDFFTYRKHIDLSYCFNTH